MGILDEAILKFESFNALKQRLTSVQTVLKEVGFCVIRGLADTKQLERNYATLKENFNASLDIRKSGSIKYGQKNFQRLDLGDYGQVSARFSRLITRFMWNPEAEFSSEFLCLQKVRNLVYNLNFEVKNGCYDAEGKRHFEFPKILHYPTGGGFLNEHIDTHEYQFWKPINLGMSVTQYGVHFNSGGVYYKLRSGEEILIDKVLMPGDIYLHDDLMRHGVHSVDGDKPIDLVTLNGRLTLILSSPVLTE